MDKEAADSLNFLLAKPIAEDGDRVEETSDGPLPIGVSNESDDSVSVLFGFPEIFSRSIARDGGQPIQRDEMNTLFNILSRQIMYFQLGGVARWNARVKDSDYFKGYPPEAIVWHNGCEWRNTGGTANMTEPGTEGSIGWTQIGPTAGTGETALDCQKLCPTLNDWHQLIDWDSITKKVVPAERDRVKGFLPEDHPDHVDDNGFMIQRGIEIVLKSSWWNWQNLCFLVDTSAAAGSPDVQFAQIPTVYLYMGMKFREANIGLGAKKLANYRWGLQMSTSSGNFGSNDLWIDLSKNFDFRHFTLGGGGYVRGIYGTGDCSACRVGDGEE